MNRHLISSSSPFESDIGYSRAVRQDPWDFRIWNHWIQLLHDDDFRQLGGAGKTLP